MYTICDCICKTFSLITIPSTLKYYPDTVTKQAIENQVYFYRQPFADTVKPEFTLSSYTLHP